MERCGGRRPTPWVVGLLVVLAMAVPAGAAGVQGGGQVTQGQSPAAQDAGSGEGRDGPVPVTVVALTTDGGLPTEVSRDGVDGAPRVDGELLTEPLEVPEFSVAAVTWDGAADLDGEITLRVRSGDSWTAWTALEPDGAGGAVDGTEPYIVGGGTGVQVRVSGEGALPANLGLHLVPAAPEADEDVVETAEEVASLTAARNAAAAGTPSAPGPGTTSTPVPGAASAASGTAREAGLSVISRAAWSADESLMTWDPELHELRAAVVHHTAGTNSYTAAQSPGIVRGIYHYHAVTRDWGDIGYNFLVDKYGQVFEGRSGSLAAPYGLMPEGAHARGFNHGSLGISVLGDYTQLRAPDSVLATMADVIAWKFSDAGIDVRTRSGMVSPGTYARPAGQQLARVVAHRDVGDTTCPGNNIYARIPSLLDSVAERVEELGSRPSAFYLKDTAAGGSADRTFALGQAADTVLIGDWDGDGVDTPALRRGNTYSFYGSFVDSEPTDVVDYGRATDTVLVGDWDGDGVDTLAVRRGKEYFMKNSISGGSADLELSYGREKDLVLVGDWDGDGADSLTVRRGRTYFLSDTLADGRADSVFDYGRAGDAVMVGDWDGSGADGLGVRRLG